MADYPKQGTVMSTEDHPDIQKIPPSDYWVGKPASERPAMPQKSNMPDPNPHTSDPWNLPFKAGGT
jgi:hypothetical protein